MIRNYSIPEFLAAIRRLPPVMPLSDRLYKSGYDTHKDHWLGWLSEYNNSDGGYYGRSDTTIRDARTVYQRIGCGEMLIWLAEAAGESPVAIRMTINAIGDRDSGRTTHAQAKIVRSRHPWERLATLIFK